MERCYGDFRMRLRISVRAQIASQRARDVHVASSFGVCLQLAKGARHGQSLQVWRSVCLRLLHVTHHVLLPEQANRDEANLLQALKALFWN